MKKFNKFTKLKISIISGIFVILICSGVFVGCGSSGDLKDGYYTAEMTEFSQGWKEYLIIQVKHGKIVSAEFNAKNESGFIKAWDNSYMENMISVRGTYPNKYTREYVQQLIDEQQDISVDAVTGASTSGANFKKLVEAVLKQAEKGDSKTVTVE